MNVQIEIVQEEFKRTKQKLMIQVILMIRVFYGALTLHLSTLFEAFFFENLLDLFYV